MTSCSSLVAPSSVPRAHSQTVGHQYAAKKLASPETCRMNTRAHVKKNKECRIPVLALLVQFGFELFVLLVLAPIQRGLLHCCNLLFALPVRSSLSENRNFLSIRHILDSHSIAPSSYQAVHPRCCLASRGLPWRPPPWPPSQSN